MSYHPRMDLRRGKRLLGIASHAIAIFIVLAGAVLIRPSNDRSVIEGFVYSGAGAEGRLQSPVAGATVSNDWDGAVASTDRLGHFQISVPRIAGDEFVVVTVRTGNTESRHRMAGGAVRGPLQIVLPESR
jgi:hypothetical protein